MPNRLSNHNLAALPQHIRRPLYDRSDIHAAIVHLGPGGFHRSHQAAYIDDVLAREKNWAICGVSLHSSQVRDALKQQDFLYTLATLDQEISYRVIGSINNILVARQQPIAVMNRLSHPDTRILSLTITEKGYCLDGQGNLDFNHPDIQQDIASPCTPVSAIGYIVQSLKLRRAAGVPPYTLLSCDNLSGNGRCLARAVQHYATNISPDLGNWIAGEVRFPCSMVDSITPYSDDNLGNQVTRATGLKDNWPVQREAFSQWVVEDNFTMGHPDWEFAGVTMTQDVDIYEQAKLRLLNAAHSALAYLGSMAEFETVYAAISEQQVYNFIHNMMIREIMPSLDTAAGFDLTNYINSILKRFHNPVIKHQLAQIAIDGSQKIPIRILATIRDNLSAGRPIAGLCLVVAGWIKYSQLTVAKGMTIDDPLAADMIRLAQQDPLNSDGFLSLQAVFPVDLRTSENFRKALHQAYSSLGAATKPDIIRALAQDYLFDSGRDRD